MIYDALKNIAVGALFLAIVAGIVLLIAAYSLMAVVIIAAGGSVMGVCYIYGMILRLALSKFFDPKKRTT